MIFKNLLQRFYIRVICTFHIFIQNLMINFKNQYLYFHYYLKYQYLHFFILFDITICCFLHYFFLNYGYLNQYLINPICFYFNFINFFMFHYDPLLNLQILVNYHYFMQKYYVLKMIYYFLHIKIIDQYYQVASFNKLSSYHFYIKYYLIQNVLFHQIKEIFSTI